MKHTVGLILIAVALLACEDRKAGGDGDVTIVDPDGRVVNLTPQADAQANQIPSAHAQAVAYADAVEVFEKAIGQSTTAVPGIATMRSAFVDREKAGEEFDAWRTDALRNGAYLFYWGQHFWPPQNEADPKAHLAILKAQDKCDVIRTLGTAGLASDVSNANVIDWLKQLDADHPWHLIGCSAKHVELRLEAVPDDPVSLALDIAKFSPRSATQVYPSVTDLAIALKDRYVILLW